MKTSICSLVIAQKYNSCINVLMKCMLMVSNFYFSTYVVFFLTTAIPSRMCYDYNLGHIFS